MLFILHDKDSKLNTACAVITTETTTREELQKAINEMETKFPDEYDQWDLEKYLPADCKLQWISDNRVWW